MSQLCNAHVHSVPAVQVFCNVAIVDCKLSLTTLLSLGRREFSIEFYDPCPVPYTVRTVFGDTGRMYRLAMATTYQPSNHRLESLE